MDYFYSSLEYLIKLRTTHTLSSLDFIFQATLLLVIPDLHSISWATSLPASLEVCCYPWQSGEIPMSQSPACLVLWQTQELWDLCCPFCTPSADPHLYLNAQRPSAIRDYQVCLHPWRPVTTWNNQFYLQYQRPTVIRDYQASQYQEISDG